MSASTPATVPIVPESAIANQTQPNAVIRKPVCATANQNISVSLTQFSYKFIFIQKAISLELGSSESVFNFLSIPLTKNFAEHSFR